MSSLLNIEESYFSKLSDEVVDGYEKLLSNIVSSNTS